MDRKEKLLYLMTIFDENKRFIQDGYYRIRSLDTDTIELAYLIAGACGESVVHPQITIFMDETQVIGTKLIDMQVSPPLFLHRDTSNACQIDAALDQLIEKFVQIT